MRRLSRVPRCGVSFNFFFTYFFLHFFKYDSIILSKSLYKIVFSGECVFAFEFEELLGRTEYIHTSRWYYDILFFINYALTFANPTILFPFFVYHLTRTFYQTNILTEFFNTLRILYYYKLNIRGIKILINGPIDRHGRSRHLVLQIGDLGISEYTTQVIYDSIQCPTPSGTIHLKFWLQYRDYDFTQNKNRVNLARDPAHHRLQAINIMT